MLHVTRFTPDPTRFAEFIACLWQGPVPDNLVLHHWLYLPGEPRSMLLVWEGDAEGDAYVARCFGSFGTLRSEAVTDATPGLAACFDRDLDAFGRFLEGSRLTPEDEIAAQLDLRRRGFEAATFEDAAAAGRAWQSEREG